MKLDRIVIVDNDGKNCIKEAIHEPFPMKFMSVFSFGIFGNFISLFVLFVFVSLSSSSSIGEILF